MRIFFLIFIFSHWSFSSKIQINLSIANVPSLIRCERNGSLFYFPHFPTDDELKQVTEKKNSHCNFIVSSSKPMIKIQLNQLELSCENTEGSIDVNTWVFFSSNCSIDSCRKFLPHSAQILTQFNAEDSNRIHHDSYIHYRHSNQIIVQELINNRVKSILDVNNEWFRFLIVKKKSLTRKNGDIRTDQIVFQYSDRTFYNMMCE